LRALTAFALAVFAAGALAARAADDVPASKVLAGTVHRVTDGDSIEAKLQSGVVRVRLNAVDSPEYDQPYGKQSSAALAALLPLGANVELEVVTQDRFERMIAEVWLIAADGTRTHINEALVRGGHVWVYRRYLKNLAFCDYEQTARDQKLGLWALPVDDWIYPAEWRFFKNAEIRVVPKGIVETRESCLATVARQPRSERYQN
jgi:endonuclease YncB( thermonuclease family)